MSQFLDGSWLHRRLPFLQCITAQGLPRAISAAIDLMGTWIGPLRAPLQPLEIEERVEEFRRILVDLAGLPPA